MTKAPLMLALVSCADWSADSVQIDGDAAPLVRDMLRPWEGATQRPPRVREVKVTADLPPGCYESCFDADTETVWLDAALEQAPMNRALSTALGRSLDDDGHGAPLSESEPWSWYGDLHSSYAADRFARAVGLGPMGARIFPGATSLCEVTDSVEDVLVVRRTVFAEPAEPLAPAAPVVRQLRLPSRWEHMVPQRLDGGGIALIGRMTEGEPTEVARIDIPDLDGDAVWVTYPDPGYSWYPRDGQTVLDPATERSWAPGLGAQLVGNYPVGETEIAGAWLEATDPQNAQEAPFVVLERARDGGEVLAVHDVLCPPREGEVYFDLASYDGRPVFVPTDDGVWVVSFERETVKMRRFGYDGEELAPRTLELDVESLYGGERFEFRW